MLTCWCLEATYHLLKRSYSCCISSLAPQKRFLPPYKLTLRPEFSRVHYENLQSKTVYSRSENDRTNRHSLWRKRRERQPAFSCDKNRKLLHEPKAEGVSKRFPVRLHNSRRHTSSGDKQTGPIPKRLKLCAATRVLILSRADFRTPFRVFAEVFIYELKHVMRR